MSTLVHINRAQAEAKNIEFARLSRALAIALTIDQLFISSAFRCHQAWHHARSIVVDHAIGAHRSTDIALCDDEGRRARRVPLVLALLTIAALLGLAVAPPERKGLLAAHLGLLEELGAVQLIMRLRVEAGRDWLQRLVVRGLTRGTLLLTLPAAATLLLWLALLALSGSPLALALRLGLSLLALAVAASTRGRRVAIVS